VEEVVGVLLADLVVLIVLLGDLEMEGVLELVAVVETAGVEEVVGVLLGDLVVLIVLLAVLL
jgi:hypothetical protein